MSEQDGWWEAEAKRLDEELARIRKLDDRAFANWRAERESLWAIRDRHAAATIAAEAKVEALKTLLGEAIDDILDLAHARWSEVEATDDELVARYRAAIAS